MLKKQDIKNKKSLKLEQAHAGRISKVKKYILIPLQVVILAVILSVTSSLVFETPEEYALKMENARHIRNLDLINAELDNLKSTLSEIQDKDDNLYRLVLGVDLLAEEMRSAGIGGTSDNRNTDAIPSDPKLSDYRDEFSQLNAKFKVQSVSFDELTTLATDNINRLQHQPSIYPIAPKDLIRYASSFGYRTHPIFKIRKFHKGIDLTALKGSPIYSTAKGIVIVANNYHDGYGNKVVIDHGFGYKTVYAHLHKIQVIVGQEMILGGLIGQVGNTGISVSPHLHYEVRLDDKPINPLNFIYKDISAEEYQLITQL
ncbi:MAG: peptidoglycan DD-metalloendopeptidase family protein [Bacteroidales bacterium]|jgi:murein DD-endopeptidase MepM/ murein hydrolase activator NlpD|nr:peptidoglycan DD-metalloendopeptidase family protein [Bacteroidales bacterium]